MCCSTEPRPISDTCAIQVGGQPSLEGKQASLLLILIQLLRGCYIQVDDATTGSLLHAHEAPESHL